MKKDKYLRARGGNTCILDIHCAKCGKLILQYQKDGIGFLHRCYINRIIAPEKWAKLQNDLNLQKPNDLANLSCDCGEIIGTPMLYKNGRLAFRLERGKFQRKRSKD